MSLKLCFLVLALLLPSSLGFKFPTYDECMKWCPKYYTNNQCENELCPMYRMVRRGDPEEKREGGGSALLLPSSLGFKGPARDACIQSCVSQYEYDFKQAIRCVFQNCSKLIRQKVIRA